MGDRDLVGKREGKRPLGKPRCRWENNIKVDLWELGHEGIDWIKQTQFWDRFWALVNAVINFRDPCSARNFLTSWEPVSFSRRTAVCSVEQ